MDIQLEKKKGLQKKHIPYIAGGALFIILVGWIIFGNHASTLKVDARGLSIGDVRKDQFNDFVRVDGQVQPITVVQLSPEEGGIVRERVVEEGAQVKKGDIIVRLSNSSLDLQIELPPQHAGDDGAGQAQQPAREGATRHGDDPCPPCLQPAEETL